MSAEFVHDGTLLACAEMLRGGITCCNDMYFYPGRGGARLRRGRHARDDRRCRCSTSRRRTRRMPTGTSRKASRCATPSAHEPLLAFCARAARALHGRRRDASAQSLTYARELDLPIQTHLHETRAELDEALAAHRRAPLARLDRLGRHGPCASSRCTRCTSSEGEIDAARARTAPRRRTARRRT